LLEAKEIKSECGNEAITENKPHSYYYLYGELYPTKLNNETITKTNQNFQEKTFLKKG